MAEYIFEVGDLVSFILPRMGEEFLAYVVEVVGDDLLVDAGSFNEDTTILVTVPMKECTKLSQSKAAEFQRKLAGKKPGMKGFIDG